MVEEGARTDLLERQLSALVGQVLVHEHLHIMDWGSQSKAAWTYWFY